MNDYLNKDMGYHELNINMDNFFDAQTAKERSIHVQSGALQDELTSIYKYINNAINNGKFSCDFEDKFFTEQALDFLKKQGYKIEYFYGDQRDPCNITTIKWQ